ncbi:unnamed protein product [Schistosoma margrebowiei]|uniref:ADF-H domain-containing protein n=1 Tax=Schistosoma margrebowiei TaxID=48269 RepID=A0AA84Z9G2_9TREM|nr:unnamed protein product [Schistosoma margrebowiei]
MSSGIKPSANCEATYRELKMDHCYRYILFRIVNNEIDVIKAAPRNETLSQFQNEVMNYQHTGCYGVLDYECEGVKGSNLIYFSFVRFCTTHSKNVICDNANDAEINFRRDKN